MASNKTIRVFEGATAIVTGGASGIGRALSVGLAKRGCEVILADLESLRIEAAQVGVRVSVICPGAVRTPILEGGGKFGKMLIDIPSEQVRRMWERLRPMSPDIFSEKVLNSVAKNKAIIIVPSWWRLFWWINRLSPSLARSLAQKRFQKMRKQLGLDQKEKSEASGRDLRDK
jgi:short-subunit dehydrogenase